MLLLNLDNCQNLGTKQKHLFLMIFLKINILKLSLPVKETNQQKLNKQTKSAHIEWSPNSP